jgi:glycosyltransferase involved in cell wall biosynthesis
MIDAPRVGFLCADNYYDRTAWSGILHFMYTALTACGLQVIDLGSPQKINWWRLVWQRLSRLKAPCELGSPKYVRRYRQFAARVERQLEKAPCDVLFAPVGSAEINYLRTTVPIIYLSDVTFALYSALYPLRLSPEEIAYKLRIDAQAAAKAARLVYPSEWAAKSAVQDCGVPAANVEVIPFGANLESAPSREEATSRSKTFPCRLLFVGKDWERKGGIIAVETLRALLARGFDAELVVVGCRPPPNVRHEKLRVVPFLNKNLRAHRARLNELLLSAHLFLFPTRAETYGIVLCEAAAFGLPVLTTDVGGIPTIVHDGINGHKLPLSATAEDYADLIMRLYSDGERFAQLVHDSREAYETRLNWDSWAARLRAVITSVAHGNAAAPAAVG